MKPKNFPGRKQVRRESAIERHIIGSKKARKAGAVARILEMVENTKANLVEDARMIRTKINREVKKYGY